MKPETEFLNVYKDYETAVRANGTDPMTIETSSAPEPAEALKMCRLFRNYLSHNNNPNFIVPTEKMIAFMKQQLTEAQLKSNTAVKNHVKKAAFCTTLDLCTDALAKLKTLKSDRLVVQDAKALTYSVVSIHDIVKEALQSKRAKLSIVKPIKQRIDFVAPTDSILSIDIDRLTLCTSDGTSTGKLIGLVVI